MRAGQGVRAAAAGGVITAVVAAVLLGGANRAAASGGGSGTGASGEGHRITSSILLGLSGGGRGSGGGSSGGAGSGGVAPRCVWHTLDDDEIVFLLAVAASMPELRDAALFRALEPYLNSAGPGVSIQVRFCDGEPLTEEVRTVPAPVLAGEISTTYLRSQVTNLTRPLVVTSPPAGTAVLVGEPVFVSIDPTQFATTVTGELEAGGRHVSVEARPSSFEVYSGEPDSGGRFVRCAGPGRVFDPASPLSPAAQARAAGACALWYRTPTGRKGRRDRWTGWVTLRWEGRYRVDGGPWLPLGNLYTFSGLPRSVTEAATTLEHR